jgi:pimeloyl-ACP methyl ester carboxylesterase
MSQREISIQSYDGRVLFGTLHTPERIQGPLVVMAHGHLGYKDWGFFPFVAESFASQGYPVLRFNFSGSGMADKVEGPFTDLKGFEADTITKQVEDLHALLSFVRAGKVPGVVTETKVFLWGHSRGGGVALLAAVRDPSVAAVATWATVSRVNRYTVDVTSEWREKGFREFYDVRTGQTLRSSVDFLEDLEKWKGLGDVPVEAFRLKVPVLLVHGLEDTSVKPGESESLAAVVPTARLVVLPGANHAFNAYHPFFLPPPVLLEAVKTTVLFFKEAR